MKALINGVNLAYDDHGIGQPVLFLHGFPLNRGMWNGEIMALLPENRYRLVALDWRGFGESDITGEISTMELFADDVAGLMDMLGMQDAVLCGLSMGGYAAFAFLRKYPERVKGLILADTRPGADTEEAKANRENADPTRSATFREAEARIPAIAAMGFDTLYMTPVHPIGHTNRKGPNNTLVAGPNDPGSPYAIGSEAGGHDAIAPELGTLDDFLHFQQTAREHGLELVLDFAIQVAPDHPWVTEHPDWFYHRPDGTIKYAENPPKKYEDIYPLNFRSPDWKNLWAALRDLVVLWAERGVRVFRVDNPHTKPLAFWEWLIRDVQSSYPDVIFLAEAFTRPKMMRALAKCGFTQSYTYFTWRNTRWELTEYLTELTQTEMREYYRGNFFANTPDILPHILQFGGRPAFRMRLVLAATLSSVYGIYSGFELCENTPRTPPGTGEYYLDSEMYQHKVWDWDRPGNIIADVTNINRIRRENPALQLYDNVRFHACDNDQLLVYSKATPDASNVILCVVNLDWQWPQAGWLNVPIYEWGIGADQPYLVHDLMTDDRFTWRGGHNWVRLDPRVEPAHVLRVEVPRY